MNDKNNTACSVNTTRDTKTTGGANMTKYTISSLTEDAHIQIVEGWTPYTLAALALVTTDESDAWHFDSMTEAVLAIFTLETHCPRLMRGLNWIVVPVQFADPQLTFGL